MAVPATKVDQSKSKPANNIPVAALKRFANDLEGEVRTNKFLQLNRERVSDFISKKNDKNSDESTPKRGGRTYKIPGINDYSNPPVSPQAKPIIHLQQLPEFQPSLGPRSRFGEGDGSFFDQWLNSDIAKTKFLFDKDGFPLMRFNGQINTGFKKHVHDVKAGLEEKVPVYIQTYAERREERLKREKEEKLAKESAAAAVEHQQAEKEKATDRNHFPSLTRSNTASSMISDISSRNSDVPMLEALKLPLIDSISLADRDAYFGPNGRHAFFESYHQLARQRYTIGLGDEEEEMEALLTARSHQMDQFAASGDEYDGEGFGGIITDFRYERDDDDNDDDSYEMGQEIDENNVLKPPSSFSRQASRMRGLLELDNEDKPNSSRGGSAVRGAHSPSARSDRDRERDRYGTPLYIEDDDMASKPGTAASVRGSSHSHSPSRGGIKSRHNTPGRPKFVRAKSRSMYSRQRMGDNQVTEEEKAHLFEHLKKETIEQQNTNRPLSARTKFLLGCVRKGILPQPSLIIRKNLTTTLSISSFGIGNDMAILLAASIANLPLLEGLSVADNNLTDVGLVPIVNALINCPSLRTFDLSRNKVDKETAKALLEFMSSPGCNLMNLRMSNANVDDTEAAKFVHIIASRVNFKELDLSGNELGSHEFALKCPETAGVALGNLLSDPRCTLETLNLSWNMLRFKSGIALVRSLKFNASLTYLDLSYNRLCDEGGDVLGDALHSNRTLRVLKLAHNNITSRPCCTILSGVVSCESLEEVDLSKNPIGEFGARLLLSVEMKYGDRVKVDIRNCQLRVRDPTCWFDPIKPQKEYVLRLNEPYARCICIQLIRLISAPNAEHSVESFQYMPPDETAYRDLELCIYSAAEAKLAASSGESDRPMSPREAEAKIEEARAMYKETASRIFHQYDTDNSGGIDRDELAIVLVQIGMEGSPAMVDQLMSIYDTDGSGLVEEEEFAAFLLDVKTGTEQAADEKPSDRYLYVKDDSANVNDRPVPYFPPDCGTVHIKLLVDKSKETIPQHISRRSVETMLDASKSSEDRSAIFDYALTVMKLQFAEAQTFYRVMLKELGSALAVLTRLLPRMSTPNDARMLITYVTGNDFEQLHLLRSVMGQIYFIYIGLPNGYYHLNLAESADQECLKALVELSNNSAAHRKKAGLGDTSQDGNWMGFRNVVYEGKNLHLTNEWLEKLPDKGKLDFDFIYINAISIMDTEISNFRLFRLMEGLGMVQEDKRKRLFDKLNIDKDDARLVSKGLGYRSTEIKSGMMEQASNYLLKLYSTCANARTPRPEVPISEAEMHFLKPNSHVGGTAVPMHPGLVPSVSSRNLQQSASSSVAKAAKPYAGAVAATDKGPSAAEVAGNSDAHSGFVKEMIESGVMDASVIAERLLETLKFALAGRFLTAVQLALLVERFPEGYMPCGDFSTYRVELIVALYTRVVDIINIDYVLKELESTEYAILLFRIGWLNIFNPIKAESRITLDLTRREERQVLRMLLILNFAEPGQSWQEPTFRPKRGAPLEEDWVLPVQWYTEATLPKEGVLTLQYYSGRGCNTYDCAPNAACRHTLMALVLAKSYSSDVWSGSKATLEVVEAMVAKMGCMLSFIDDVQHDVMVHSTHR